MENQFQTDHFENRGASVVFPVLAALGVRAGAELATLFLPNWIGFNVEHVNAAANGIIVGIMCVAILRCIWSRITSYAVARNELSNLTPCDELEGNMIRAMDHLESLRKACTTVAYFLIVTAVLIAKYRWQSMLGVPDAYWMLDAAPIVFGMVSVYLLRRLCKTGAAYLQLANAVKRIINAFLRAGN
jgi:hypothetical protein